MYILALHPGVNAPGKPNNTTLPWLNNSSVLYSFIPSLNSYNVIPAGILSPTLIDLPRFDTVNTLYNMLVISGAVVSFVCMTHDLTYSFY